MANPPLCYWDACVWIGFINEEPGRFEQCRNIIRKAKAKELLIVTSSFTLTEVVKRKCADGIAGVIDEDDDAFAELLKQDYVIIVNADWDAGIKARELYRKYNSSGLKKPQDALHLATAVLENVDEMHTYDGCDLIKLRGLVRRSDGVLLNICEPPESDDPADKQIALPLVMPLA